MQKKPGKLIAEQIVYKYGLKYTTRHWLADNSDLIDDPKFSDVEYQEELKAVNKYDIEVEIGVLLDERDWTENIGDVPRSQGSKYFRTDATQTYIALASETSSSSELTEEAEQDLIDLKERQVAALYRKLRNWKRKGRI
jgi:hypothetical protein